MVDVTASNKLPHERRLPVNFRDVYPIVFTERGVEIFVFGDGPFDFNTRPWLQLFYYYKLSGSRSINGSYGAPINNRDHNFRVKV
jgi:hypothetical protein